MYFNVPLKLQQKVSWKNMDYYETVDSQEKNIPERDFGIVEGLDATRVSLLCIYRDFISSKELNVKFKNCPSI